jgi:hypothetical protein
MSTPAPTTPTPAAASPRNFRVAFCETEEEKQRALALRIAVFVDEQVRLVPPNPLSFRSLLFPTEIFDGGRNRRVGATFPALCRVLLIQDNLQKGPDERSLPPDPAERGRERRRRRNHSMASLLSLSFPCHLWTAP